jgi:hypothetical protein
MLSRRLLCSCARQASCTSRRTFTTITPSISSSRLSPHQSLRASTPTSRPSLLLRRTYASQTTADEKVDELQELYATAKDEFEIAAEETEKMTVYAQDDRDAAREELSKLQAAYRAVAEGEDKVLADEVKRRVGQRVRELENAVQAMEEMAMNQD